MSKEKRIFYMEDDTYGYGVIRKAIELTKKHTKNPNGENNPILSVVIDTYNKTVKVRRLIGTIPCYDDLYMALLADVDIRRMVMLYESKGKQSFKIWKNDGYSSKYGYTAEIFMRAPFGYGEKDTSRDKKICEKSNSGLLLGKVFGDSDIIRVDKFVALADFLGLLENMDMEYLKKESGVKYVIPYLQDEV